MKYCIDILIKNFIFLVLLIFKFTLIENTFALDITWTNTSANITVTGNSITKSSGTNTWDAGGESVEVFSGNGIVEFSATQINRSIMCGLSTNNLNNNYNTINYAIYMASNNHYYTYENGSNRGDFGIYSIGDVFSVERAGTLITYKRNGSVFYTSSMTIANEAGLLVDSSINTVLGSIDNVKIIGATQDVPSKISNVVPDVGNSEVFLDWTAPINNTLVITDYEIRYAPVGDPYGASILTGSTLSEYIVTGLTNGVKYKFQVRAINALGACPDYSDEVTMTPSVFFDVTWINTSADITVTANSIAKTSGTSTWDSGGESFTTFSGDGALSFKALEINRNRMCGLSSVNTDDNYNTINYAVYMRGDSHFLVYENGSNRGDFGIYTIGDIFTVSRVGTSISYKKNDVVFYTSGISISNEIGLLADSSLSTVLGTIDDVKIIGVTPSAPGRITQISADVGNGEVFLDWKLPANNASSITDYEVRYAPVGDPYGASILTGSTLSEYMVTGLTNGVKYKFQVRAINALGTCPDYSDEVTMTPSVFFDVTWINTSVDITVTGNSLTKTSGVSAWDSGGESFTTFSGDGALSFTAAQTNRYRMCGLSSANTNDNYNTINYAIYMAGNSHFYVYENGSNRGDFGLYTIGDIFTVSRVGTTVSYKKNDVVFYISGISVSNEIGLFADCSIYNIPGSIDDVKIIGVTPSAPGRITQISADVGNGEVFLDWKLPANNASSITDYEVRYAPVGDPYGASILTGSTLSEYMVTGLTNGVKYKFQVRAINALGTCPDYSDEVTMTPSVFFDVTWINTSVDITVTGNSLTKTSGTSAWNAGGESFTTFSGDGALSFTAAQTNRYRMCGLSSANINDNYNTINYAIYMAGNSHFYVYENGSNRGDFGLYTIGDIFTASRVGTTVSYKKNDVVFYTSGISVSNEIGLLADCSINTVLGSLDDAKIIGVTPSAPGRITQITAEVDRTGVFLDWNVPANNASSITDYEVRYAPVGDSYGASILTGSTLSEYMVTGLTNGVKYKFQVRAINALGTCPDYSDEVTMTPSIFFDVFWINPSTNATVIGNSISKTSGSNAWDAGAESFTSFSGNGALSFTATQTNRYRMCGLSSANTNNHYNTINYAIYMAGNRNYYIYENGSNRGNFGVYSIGDIFSIERTGNTISYKKNDAVFYTSGITVLNEIGLLADCSIYNLPGSINDAKIVGVTPGVPGKVLNVVPKSEDKVITLTWDIPANNNSAIIEYEIQYGPVYSGGFDRIIIQNTASLSISGLSLGTEYQFRILARNVYGAGPLSDVVTATPVSLANIVWTDLVNVTDFGGTSSVAKNVTGNSWNAGAASVNSFLGYGGIEFEITHTNRYRMCGLSPTNSNANYNTIYYAIYIAGNGRFYVYERGANRGNFGTYSVGDKFTIERSGNRIKYKKNNIIFYTSNITTSALLIADCSIYNQPGSIDNAKMFSSTAITNFRTSLNTDTNVVTLEWDNPSLLEYAAFSGSMIRYSTTSFPATITDGALLGSFNNLIETATHSNVNSEATYYYSIFAYDSIPIYELPVTARAVINDFTSPDRVTSLVAERDIESVKLTWTNPDISSYPNEDLEGIMIRRSVTGFPLTHEEGEEVILLIHNENTYIDTGLDPNQTYYYSLFSYDEVPLYSDPEHAFAKPLHNVNELVIVPSNSVGNYNSFFNPSVISGEPLSLKIIALTPEKNPVATLSEMKQVEITSSYVTKSSNYPVTIDNVRLPSTLNLEFTKGISNSFNLTYYDAGVISLNASSGSNTEDISDDYKTFLPLQINNIPKAFDINILNNASKTHEVLGRPFVLKVRSVISYGENLNLVNNSTTPSYFSSAINLSSELINSSYSLGSLSSSTISILNEGFVETSLIYNELGTIKINAKDSDFLGGIILGMTNEISFTPQSFDLSLINNSKTRYFYYIDELINLKISALDYNQNIIKSYKDKIELLCSDSLSLIKSYTFHIDDNGIHEFSFYANKDGYYDIKVQDSIFSDVFGILPSLEVKYAEIKFESVTVNVNESAKIMVKIIDKDGKIITEDNETTFLIEISEEKKNESTSSTATTIPVNIQGGIGFFSITNQEAETVKIKLISTPKLPNLSEEIIFSENVTTGIGKGGLRILFWKEVRE